MTRFSANSRNVCRGFTLLELLLAMVLVLLLTSALVFNFSNLLQGNHLAEGTTRVETLMRYARAQAANSGCKVQLVFGGEPTNSPSATTGEVRATWEPDPLGQPGFFAELVEAQWHLEEINDLVQVESVKLLDSPGAGIVDLTSEAEFAEETTNAPAAKPMAPITFYPDGSSDSAEIILAARAAEDDQRMAVRLVGITGSIRHRLLMADYGLPLGESESDAVDPLAPILRNDEAPASTMEPESMPPESSSRPAVSSSRLRPKPPRTPIGETNTAGFAE